MVRDRENLMQKHMIEKDRLETCKGNINKQQKRLLINSCNVHFLFDLATGSIHFRKSMLNILIIKKWKKVKQLKKMSLLLINFDAKC
jgi:hypothetical protein